MTHGTCLGQLSDYGRLRIIRSTSVSPSTKRIGTRPLPYALRVYTSLEPAKHPPYERYLSTGTLRLLRCYNQLQNRMSWHYRTLTLNTGSGWGRTTSQPMWSNPRVVPLSKPESLSKRCTSWAGRLTAPNCASFETIPSVFSVELSSVETFAQYSLRHNAVDIHADLPKGRPNLNSHVH